MEWVEYPEFSRSTAPSIRKYWDSHNTVNRYVLSGHIKDKQATTSTNTNSPLFTYDCIWEYSSVHIYWSALPTVPIIALSNHT